MKKLVILFILIGMSTTSSAAITTAVYKADGNTPYNGKPLMVGTKLSIVGSSVNDDPCNCELLIPWDYFDENGDPLYGVLTGRDLNPDTYNYDGSLFPAAGRNANVYDDIEPDWGFGLGFWYGSEAVAGKWFIIDYTALNVGECNVNIYKYDAESLDPVIFTSTYTFHHVPTRDFNADTIVNFKDFSTLAHYWQQNCGSDGCQGADVDNSGRVNMTDLMLFCDYWLEKTQ